MKLSRLSLPAALVGALAVGGCTADVPTAVPRSFQISASRSISADGAPKVAPRYVVVFNGKAPANFESKVAALGGTVLLNHKIGVAVVTDLDDAAAAKLKSAVGASFVEAQPDFELIEPAAQAEPELASLDAAAAPLSAADPTTARYFAALQWNMRAIHADAAWAAGYLGSKAVRVAILDTGIDYTLPDLAGLVDLDHSVSFEPVDDYYTALFFPGRNPSTDLHFHGTNVATQVSSNAVYFAGVTSKTTLMSVKVCSVVGGCHGVTEGLLYAIENGADVINMSLGGWFKKSAYPGTVAAYNKIMNYAKQQGVTIVVAAGNDADDLDTQQNIAIKDATGKIVDRVHVPSFFATYCDATQVICVSAVSANDVPASFTNYGRSAIDVAAPGGGDGAWVYALCPRTSLLYNCSDEHFIYRLGVAGTSQATPHVSGLAALMVQRYGRSPSQVKNAIRQSADDLGQPGNDPYFGAGRINVARAVGLN